MIGNKSHKTTLEAGPVGTKIKTQLDEFRLKIRNKPVTKNMWIFPMLHNFANLALQHAKMGKFSFSCGVSVAYFDQYFECATQMLVKILYTSVWNLK